MYLSTLPNVFVYECLLQRVVCERGGFDLKPTRWDKMYLLKFLNVFVQFAKCICARVSVTEGCLWEGGFDLMPTQMRCASPALPKLWLASPIDTTLPIISKSICPNCYMYFPRFQNLFIWIAKCICSNCKMYLSKLQNIFVQIVNCARLDFALL